MIQATLRETLHFEGIGLHTGARSAVEVRPAKVDEGISFVLGATRVPATVDFVVDTSRATVLGRNGATVSTTEHLLSALDGLGAAIRSVTTAAEMEAIAVAIDDVGRWWR